MADSPRVRFSPSPTGPFHVGSARTALFNWLFARANDGTFILRIEDTDPERDRPEWIDVILDSMTWLGLDWDEGPYRQSGEQPAHLAAAQKLYESGHAYYCDCTPDDVKARTGNPSLGYDGFCRDRGLEPGPGRSLRFKVPHEGETVVHDAIRGEPSFENATIADFVIVRSTGTPVFVLANVVDDVAMDITHVIRGEEHLSTTPKYLLIRKALTDKPEPQFAHVPLLVNEKRQKLSKRRDKVALGDYRDLGFLSEAMRNYLVLLGWQPGDDREIVTIEEVIASFRLEDISKSPAFFDVDKLTHINSEYIRAEPVERFVERSEPWLPESFDRDVFARLAPLVQERVRVLSEVPGMVEFLFVDEPEIDDAAWQKATKDRDVAAKVLDAAAERYASCDWDAESIKQATFALSEELDLKMRKTQAPIRVAVTGKGVGLPLFESLEALGRERTLERISRARARLTQVPA
ncbi:MAG: glutamyl-tRNA synthetase [Thermoleophilaceae bacterium]|nr:glutamyl-tRNA synthetase [Thermoleophilaceae bacterium]